MTVQSNVLVLTLCLWVISAQKDPNFVTGRSTIVHLFEWKWNDIADECERFLQDKGYAGVQISPPNENLVLATRPWYERYQAVSYIFNTRSGDEEALSDMIQRCNNVGIRIYADIVLNHMTFASGNGTAASLADRENKSYPAVPYNFDDFHESCEINNQQDPSNVRNCEVAGSADLDQSLDYVRETQLEFMNRLIDLGVAGFRIDLAENMWPEDLGVIFSGLKNLNTNFGFAPESTPFIYQEVSDLGGTAISKYEYTDIGDVLEFQYGLSLSNAFQGGTKLANLQNWGPEWNFLNSSDAVAFIDNHDNQRAQGSQILIYKNPKPYIMAIAFMLAHPYGTTRIISSFLFDTYEQGPPQDDEGNLISPEIRDDGTCGNGYVCEHRWPQIYNMVRFRNIVEGTDVENWWSDGDNQIAFSRGSKGFVAFTNGGDLSENLDTNLSIGTYCDVVSGILENGECTGKVVQVDEDGMADIFLGADKHDGVLAIHINAKLEK